MVTKEQVLRLRERSGAGIMDCRRALESAGGSEERALELLREQGSVVAESKAGRVAVQGVVGSYVHPGGSVAALVLLRCETDFVAKSPVFLTLAKDLAMQVAAMNPTVIHPSEVPPGEKPEEVALLAQSFIKDDTGRQSVHDILNAKVLELKERIEVERIIRFQV